MDNPQYHNPYSAGAHLAAPEPGGQIYGESLPTLVVVTGVLEILFLLVRAFSVAAGILALMVLGGAFGQLTIPTFAEIITNLLMILIGGPIVLGMLFKRPWAEKYAWIYIVATLVSYLVDVWKIFVLVSQSYGDNTPAYIGGLVGGTFAIVVRIAFLVLFLAGLKKFKDYLISKSLYRT